MYSQVTRSFKKMIKQTKTGFWKGTVNSSFPHTGFFEAFPLGKCGAGEERRTPCCPLMTYFGANPPAQCPATSQALQLLPTGAQLMAAWRDGPVLSPPLIPSREIWLAGGRGCPYSSGEITEISPHHSAVFLCGALARRAARDLLVSSASWSCGSMPFANLLVWPWTSSPAQCKAPHLYERQMFLTPSMSYSFALSVGHLLTVLLSHGEGSRWALFGQATCQGRCKLSQKESRGEVKSAPAPV